MAQASERAFLALQFFGLWFLFCRYAVLWLFMGLCHQLGGLSSYCPSNLLTPVSHLACLPARCHLLHEQRAAADVHAAPLPPRLAGGHASARGGAVLLSALCGAGGSTRGDGGRATQSARCTGSTVLEGLMLAYPLCFYCRPVEMCKGSSEHHVARISSGTADFCVAALKKENQSCACHNP